MKTVTLIALSIFSLSQISQAQYQSERKFDTFEKIIVTDGIKAKVFLSNEHKVILSVSDMPETRVMTDLSAYELSLRLERGIYEKGQVYAEIYLKSLKSLDIRDNADVEIDKSLSGDALVLRAVTSSRAKLDLDYNYLELNLATSSSVEILGKVKIVDANVGTSASLKAYDLESETFKAKTNTQGEIFVKTENSLEAQATTGGKIYYKGEPARLSEKSSLGGEVIEAK